MHPLHLGRLATARGIVCCCLRLALLRRWAGEWKKISNVVDMTATGLLCACSLRRRRLLLWLRLRLLLLLLRSADLAVVVGADLSLIVWR